MKNILFILIISQFFICNRNEKKNIVIEKDNPFVGKWSFIIVSGYNCYMCPKIEFGKNDKGNFINSRKEMEFNYELLPNDKIKIDFIKAKISNSFNQSEVFYYENGTVDDVEQIDLSNSKNGEIIHTLIRNVK